MRRARKSGHVFVLSFCKKCCPTPPCKSKKKTRVHSQQRGITSVPIRWPVPFSGWVGDPPLPPRGCTKAPRGGSVAQGVERGTEAMRLKRASVWPKARKGMGMTHRRCWLPPAVTCQPFPAPKHLADPADLDLPTLQSTTRSVLREAAQKQRAHAFFAARSRHPVHERPLGSAPSE